MNRIVASSYKVLKDMPWKCAPRSHEPLMKKDREKTLKKVKNLHLGPENSVSPNRLFNILTKEQVVHISMIQTIKFITARYSGPK